MMRYMDSDFEASNHIGGALAFIRSLHSLVLTDIEKLPEGWVGLVLHNFTKISN